MIELLWRTGLVQARRQAQAPGRGAALRRQGQPHTPTSTHRHGCSPIHTTTNDTHRRAECDVKRVTLLLGPVLHLVQVILQGEGHERRSLARAGTRAMPARAFLGQQPHSDAPLSSAPSDRPGPLPAQGDHLTPAECPARGTFKANEVCHKGYGMLRRGLACSNQVSRAKASLWRPASPYPSCCIVTQRS